MEGKVAALVEAFFKDERFPERFSMAQLHGPTLSSCTPQHFFMHARVQPGQWWLHATNLFARGSKGWLDLDVLYAHEGQLELWEQYALFRHKETHILTDNHASELTREQFTSVFRLKDCRSRCFVEATPANIRTEEAPRTLFGLMTAAERAASKFLLIVREPVARDISCFNHNLFKQQAR